MPSTSNQSVGNTIKDTIAPSSHDLFDNIDVQEITGVRVFYIGQGDAIGLLDENNKVALYIDYGGLHDHPDKSNNYTMTANRLPPIYPGTRKNVGVILTHWDKDHYYSAKKVPDILNGEWIVPRQKIGVQATQFSATLTNAYCWPEHVGNKSFSFSTGKGDEVLVEKIAPSPGAPSKKENRNHTGLAVSILRNDPDSSTRTNTTEFITLPGDAPYNRIAHFPILKNKFKFKGGTAYHHGSHSHWVKATSTVLGSPTSDELIVFSYGPNNRYGHPDADKYDALGWNSYTDETPTTASHVDIMF